MKYPNLRCSDYTDFVIAEKMSGLNTHAVEANKPGLVELLSEELRQHLLVVHRLDKGTSGALIFAKSKESAKIISNLFEDHLIQKSYLFVTDRKMSQEKISRKSFIERLQNQFVSDASQEPNSHTEFEFVQKVGTHFLWRAKPVTGKPHQIRLHAKDLGMPILGDTLHGGTPYLRICLHCHELKFNFRERVVHHQSPIPFWANPELNKEGHFISLDEALILNALESRQLQFEYSNKDCIRLIHQESEHFRADQFGDMIWVYWYKATPPNDQDLQIWKRVSEREKKSVLIRLMQNRGSDPQQQLSWKIGDCPTKWSAFENDVLMEFRADVGLSPGLFLDQRNNRRWIQENSVQKRLLNLFCYTGGFSVNAALGGATSVVSVDLSKTFIDWSKVNFALNKIPLNAQYEFWVADTFLFLKGAIKKHREFDLIICDPPSFSRGKERIFRIEKDLAELLDLMVSCLAIKGKILLCTNYEKWTYAEFLAVVQESLMAINKRRGAEKNTRSLLSLSIEAPLPGVDFEKIGEETLMKSLWIQYR